MTIIGFLLHINWNNSHSSRLGLCLLAGMCAGLFLGASRVHAQSTSGGGAVDLTVAIQRVAKETIPAVVHIEVTERQEIANPMPSFWNDPFFRYFFNVPQNSKKFQREVKGLGTGMFMDAQGHILTNNHVAGGATKIEALLADGRKYPARLVGADPKTDLAVIKIDAKEPVPFVTFGNSDNATVGEWVVAIGHPRGLDQTVTQGIISAKHRQGITDPDSYQDFLQTDAEINPGNSGGPLLNLHGQVIGVNAAIASQTGGFEGIGFAIPSNMAVYVAKALMAHGKVKRAWLGVSVQDMTPELATSLNLSPPKGALIADVTADAPAAQAGLKRGDVIVAYAERAITDSAALRNAVATTPVGQTVQVTVVRSGQKKDVTVTVRNLEEATKALLASLKERLGVEVRPVSVHEAERYDMDAPKGVTITWVDAKGALGRAGLEVQDILLAIDGQAIEGVDSLINLIGAIKPRQEIAVMALDHRSGETGVIQATIR